MTLLVQQSSKKGNESFSVSVLNVQESRVNRGCLGTSDVIVPVVRSDVT